MQKTQIKDRRACERIPIELSLRFLNHRTNKEGLAQAVDISANGIGLLTEEELSPSIPLEIWLQIPDYAEPVYIKGEVVWSKMVKPNGYRAGIRLEKINLVTISQVLKAILKAI